MRHSDASKVEDPVDRFGEGALVEPPNAADTALQEQQQTDGAHANGDGVRVARPAEDPVASST